MFLDNKFPLFKLSFICSTWTMWSHTIFWACHETELFLGMSDSNKNNKFPRTFILMYIFQKHGNQFSSTDCFVIKYEILNDIYVFCYYANFVTNPLIFFFIVLLIIIYKKIYNFLQVASNLDLLLELFCVNVYQHLKECCGELAEVNIF